MKTWLITGGCGFIGTNLINELIKDNNNHIRIIDNLSVGQRDDLSSVCDFEEVEPDQLSQPNKQCQLIVGDILDEHLAVEISKGVDVIVHLAASTGVAPSVEDPRQDCLTNVLGTLNYLEAARINNIKRFVFASSGAPVGEVEPPIHEELAAHPVSPYGASKLSGEGYCSAYYQTFGVETVALRFGNVYGPGSTHKSSVVAKFIKRALNGESLEIYGDGNQTRDFIYISDLISAVLLAATKEDIGGEVFQIATNRETTLNELVSEMVDAFAMKSIKAPEIINSAPRLGDVKRNFSDTTKAQNKLIWRQTVLLNQGLKKTIDWFTSKEL